MMQMCETVMAITNLDVKATADLWKAILKVAFDVTSSAQEMDSSNSYQLDKPIEFLCMEICRIVQQNSFERNVVC